MGFHHPISVFWAKPKEEKCLKIGIPDLRKVKLFKVK